MKKELEIWKFALEKLTGDRNVVLLVVAVSSGSSPGRQGFKMIVSDDELCGSIGGGVMEVALVEKAKRQLEIGNRKIENGEREAGIQDPKAEIVEQTHRKNAPNASGMICSGTQTVIFYELDQSALPEVSTIVEALESQRSKQLIINNSKLIITNPEEGSHDFRFEKFSQERFEYEERIGFKNKLYIVGGGHCALALSELAAKLDFHVSLFDDRAGLNTVEKNEFAHAIRVIESYEDIADFIPSGDNAYTVVMTLGYKFDEIVIRKLFDKDFKYFGVLGSRAKMKTLLKNLEKEGFDKGKLNEILTPVGLKINSRTPEEIAVSIAAEIISVKNA